MSQPSVRPTAIRPGSTRPRIARQVVRDRAGAVTGYEFLFRAGTGAVDGDFDPAERDAVTAEVITAAFGEFALHRLGARRSLYVNPTRDFLVGRLPMPFTPHHVVLEVLEPIEVDDELVEGLRDLRTRGFRVGVNLYVGGPSYDELLPLVDVVKLDVPAIGPDLTELVAHVRESTPNALLLGEGITAQSELDDCLAAGLDLFTGRHFERRTPDPTGRVKPSQLISLQLLAALADRHSSTDELERIVSADPAITLRVLATVNSVPGAQRHVTSLRQAVVLVGRRTLSAWVMLAALGSNPERRRDDMVAILTRARTCELLSEQLPDVDALTAFAAGLLSGLVEVLGVDPHQLVRDTRLDEVLAVAVVGRRGQVGALLEAVEEFVRTGHTTSLVSAAVMSRAHLEGLAVAVETVDSLLGD